MLLITGASGFVGRHFLTFLKDDHSPLGNKVDILPAYHRTVLEGGISVNLTDESAVKALFQNYDITAVIHLAAEARPGVCEADNEAARQGNVVSTRNLLNGCKGKQPFFLYVSTDTVFSGNKTLYHENDAPDPINAYGRSKAEAEALVRKYEGPWCIVRPALIYGAEINGKSSFLSWMLNVLKTGDGCFYCDELRSPIWVDDLVRLLSNIISDRIEGIIHAGGVDCLSRVDFAELVADVWDLPKDNISITSLDADPSNTWRPRNVCLHSPNAHSLIEFTNTRNALLLIRKSGVS